MNINTTYSIVFDLDGTLIDTDMANNLSYKKAVYDILGYQIAEGCKRLTRETIQLMFNIDSYTMQKIIADKECLFPNYLNRTSTLSGYYLLRHLKAPSVILLTNARQRRAKLLLDYYNLHNSFSRIYYREDYSGISKFEYLIQTVGINSTGVILFENEDNMIQEAIRLGIPPKNIFKS